MSRVNGKQKGNSFERYVANVFSSRFSGLFKVDKPFRRNVDSGSFYGRNNSVRMHESVGEHIHVSDILSPSGFRFILECKSYKSAPNLFNVLVDGSDLINSWIHQVSGDVSGLNSVLGSKYVPALVLKWNRVPVYVMCPLNCFSDTGLSVDHFVYRFDSSEMWVGLSLDNFLNLDDSFFLI